MARVGSTTFPSFGFGTLLDALPSAPRGGSWKCAKDGCGGNPTTLAGAQSSPIGIAVDDTNVYWTNDDSTVAANGTIMKCAKDGCGGRPTTRVGAQTFPRGIVVDATSVYWTLPGGWIMKLTQK